MNYIVCHQLLLVSESCTMNYTIKMTIQEQLEDQTRDFIVLYKDMLRFYFGASSNSLKVYLECHHTICFNFSKPYLIRELYWESKEKGAWKLTENI